MKFYQLGFALYAIGTLGWMITGNIDLLRAIVTAMLWMFWYILELLHKKEKESQE